MVQIANSILRICLSLLQTVLFCHHIPGHMEYSLHRKTFCRGVSLGNIGGHKFGTCNLAIQNWLHVSERPQDCTVVKKILVAGNWKRFNPKSQKTSSQSQCKTRVQSRKRILPFVAEVRCNSSPTFCAKKNEHMGRGWCLNSLASWHSRSLSGSPNLKHTVVRVQWVFTWGTWFLCHHRGFQNDWRRNNPCEPTHETNQHNYQHPLGQQMQAHPRSKRIQSHDYFLFAEQLTTTPRNSRRFVTPPIGGGFFPQWGISPRPSLVCNFLIARSKCWANGSSEMYLLRTPNKAIKDIRSITWQQLYFFVEKDGC